MHSYCVEALVAQEEAALQDAVAAGLILRIERRGLLLIAELLRTVYEMQRAGAFGWAVPILAPPRTLSIVVALRCDNYDTDPPSVAFMKDWTAIEELPYEGWPKGAGIVQRHYETGKPFLCRPGVREFHAHVQHGDEPWDKYRGKLRLRNLLVKLAHDLRSKQVG